METAKLVMKRKPEPPFTQPSPDNFPCHLRTTYFLPSIRERPLYPQHYPDKFLINHLNHHPSTTNSRETFEIRPYSYLSPTLTPYHPKFSRQIPTCPPHSSTFPQKSHVTPLLYPILPRQINNLATLQQASPDRFL